MTVVIAWALCAHSCDISLINFCRPFFLEVGFELRSSERKTSEAEALTTQLGRLLALLGFIIWCKLPFVQLYSGKYMLGNCIWWQMSIGANFHSCKLLFVQWSILANIRWEIVYGGKCPLVQLSIRANSPLANWWLHFVGGQLSVYRKFLLRNFITSKSSRHRVTVKLHSETKTYFLTLPSPPTKGSNWT